MCAFISEYVDKLNSSELNEFSNLIEQNLHGDKSLLLNELSKDNDIDKYLKSANNVVEFYEYLDNIEKAILDKKTSKN